MSKNATSQRYDSLSGTQREILRVIAEHGPITGPELVASVDRSQSVVYQNVPVLLDGGLVESEAVDGRTNEYSLSEGGRDLLRDHAAAVAGAAGYRIVGGVE